MTDVLHEQWARDLHVRIGKLRWQRRVAIAERPTVEPARAEAADAVEHFLDDADAAIMCRERRPQARSPQERRPRGRSLLDRWRGLAIVTAYENVHAAEGFLIDLMTDDQIKVLVPSIVTRNKAVLDDTNPCRQELALPTPLTEDTKTLIKRALQAGYQAEDQIYLRIRTFRNLVVKSTALLFVLMAVMVWLVASHPRSMPLCFTPGSDTATTATAPPTCPSGDDKQPSAEDVLIVAGLGLLGSAAAAAFSIRKIQGRPTPYDVPVALAFFKLPLGVFTAVTGLLLLGGNFVPGLSELDSQRQILAYALAFGYAQQLVSRLIDNRARMIVGRLPMAQHPDRPPDKDES